MPPVRNTAPAGQRALFAWSHWQIQVVDKSGDRLAAYRCSNVSRLALSPEGKRAVYYDPGASELRVCDLGGLNARLLWKPPKGESPSGPRLMSWSPDGRRVVFHYNGQLNVIPVAAAGDAAAGG